MVKHIFLVIIYLFIIPMHAAPSALSSHPVLTAEEMPERDEDSPSMESSLSSKKQALRSVSEPESKKFNEAQLRVVAETHGFGYKTANLAELVTLCTEFNRRYGVSSVQLKVPVFIGIASNKIQEKLLAVDFDCSAQWKMVVETIAETEQAAVFEAKQFPKAFLVAREAFNVALNQAWGRIRLTSGQSLDQFFGITGLDELLGALARNGNRLMVRSTGKEDTKELANAGGNASVANVEPTEVSVLEAIREVVESYFGMKSLTQRLGLGDKTLFSPEAFTPVLVQEMIGEKTADKSVVRCGVMFTEEPEGHVVSVAVAGGAGGSEAEGPAGGTTGITLIQAAYGHNEAVVNSLIPVDTYYVTSGKAAAIYPVIRAKKSRLVPAVAGDSRLSMQPNKKILVMAQALTDEQIRILKAFGDNLEQHYGYPMDVEFVVKETTIFIVQARPIVHKKGSAGPSYLRDGIVGDLFKGSSIGSAGGSVREIDAVDQMLVAPTIGVALNSYLQPGFDARKIKAVLVGGMAPSTSHEATTFRNQGLPVLFVEQWDSLANSVSAGKKLLVSPQQNMVVAVDRAMADYSLPGWNSYPVPRILSVIPPLLGRLKTVLPPKAPGPVEVKPIAWSALLATMKAGDSNAVVKATAQFLSQLKDVFKKHAIHKTLVSDVKDLQEAAKILCQQIVSLAHCAVGSERYLCRLLPIKMLEALVYQQVDASDVFKPLSLATVGTIVKDELVIQAGGSTVKHPASSTAAAGGAGAVEPEAALEVVAMPSFSSPRLKDYYVQLRKLDNNIFVDSIRNDWDWLLGQAAGNVAMMTGVVVLVKQLTDVLLLPTWLHSDFATTMRDEVVRNPENIAAALTKWHRNLARDKAFLGELLEKYAIVKGMNLSAFADAGRCHAAWQQFNDHVVSYFAGAGFKRAYETAGPYGRLSAVKMLREMITTFDESIKGVKGNSSMPNSDKLPMFKTMLQQNFSLLKNVAYLLPEGSTAELDCLMAGGPDREESFELMRSIIDKDFIPGDLLPTPGVSTFIFAMGSGHNWMQTEDKPSTGEDIFSVMHQSLLNICSVLSSKVGLVLERSPVLKQVEDALVLAGGKVKQKYFDDLFVVSNFTGVDADSHSMTVYYNIPLGAHSCLVSLTYSHKTKLVTVTAHFCGGFVGERYRWCDIGIEVLLASGTDQIKTSLNELSNHLVSASLTFGGVSVRAFERLWECLIAIASERDYSVISYTKPQEEYKVLMKRLLSFTNNDIGAEATGRVLVRLALAKDPEFTDIIKLVIEGAARGGQVDLLLGEWLEKIMSFSDAELARIAAMVVQYAPVEKSFTLLKVLVQRGRCFELVGAYVRKYLDEDDMDSFDDEVISFSKALVEKGYGIHEANLLINKCLAKNPAPSVAIIELLQALLEQGVGFETANSIVNTYWEEAARYADYLEQEITKLLQKLIEKKQLSIPNSKNIIAVSVKKIQMCRNKVAKYKVYREIFLAVSNILFDQGQEFDFLIKACEELKIWCQEPDGYDKQLYTGIGLLEGKLVESMKALLDEAAKDLVIDPRGSEIYKTALIDALSLFHIRIERVSGSIWQAIKSRANGIQLQSIINKFYPLKDDADQLKLYKTLMFERLQPRAFGI